MPIDAPPLRVSVTEPGEDERDTSWTLALAAGDGARLKDYIEHRHGQRIPKQYCQLLDSRSMLEHTITRLNQLTPASRTLTVIGTDHRPYAIAQLAGLSDHVLCQPSSRNTGVALFVALAMIKRWAPNATVTITPTDHHVDPNARYLEHVRTARSVAARLRDRVVVLAVQVSEADSEYSYVSAAEHVAEIPEARHVARFVERPSIDHASELIAAGALCSTMVVCGTVEALWTLGRKADPHLIDILDSFVPLVGTPEESDAIEYIYRAYLPVSFATDMLARAPQQLAVVELDGVEWSDCGTPHKVEAVLARRRTRAQVQGSVGGP